MGTPAGEAVARALETNTTLSSLNVSYNRLEDAAGLEFARVLDTNTTLTSLNLKMNRIQQAAGLAFARVLETNITLAQLNLSANNIDDTMDRINELLAGRELALPNYFRNQGVKVALGFIPRGTRKQSCNCFYYNTLAFVDLKRCCSYNLFCCTSCSKQ